MSADVRHSLLISLTRLPNSLSHPSMQLLHLIPPTIALPNALPALVSLQPILAVRVVLHIHTTPRTPTGPRIIIASHTDI